MSASTRSLTLLRPTEWGALCGVLLLLAGTRWLALPDGLALALVAGQVLLPVGVIVTLSRRWAREVQEAQSPATVFADTASFMDQWQRPAVPASAPDVSPVADKSASPVTWSNSHFLDGVGAEVRSGLHSIIGLVQLCIENEKNAAQKDYLSLIQQSAEKVLRSVSGVFDLSRLDGGLVKLAEQPFDLTALVLEVAETTGDALKGKAVQLTWSVAPDVPRGLMGDRQRLQQVLSSLCAHAERHTESGQIAIACRIAQPVENGVELVFEVRDTGSGVPPVDAELLMEDMGHAKWVETSGDGFPQVMDSGIGLLVSRKLVHLMGGDIRFESLLGKGTKAVFSVRLAVSNRAPSSFVDRSHAAKEASPTGSWQVTGARWGAVALVVEDNPVNRLVTREMLQRMGFSVREAVTGVDAIRVVQTEHIDVILMDLQMPEMGGLEAAKLIRSSSNNRTVPIVALSGMPPERAVREAEDAGMNGYLSKPVQSAELAEVMGRVLTPPL